MSGEDDSTTRYPVDAWACVLDWVTDVENASRTRSTCRLFRDLLHRRKRFTRKRGFRTAMIEACGEGNLERVVFLHDTHPGWTCGRSCVLHGTVSESCRKQFSDLDTAIWCRRTKSLCLANAMDNAAQHGHLEVVRWLHLQRTEGCTTHAMDSALVAGHMHVAQWLRENRSEAFSAYAFLEVAKRGRLEALQWMDLKDETLICCMRNVCEGGHLETAKWLQEKTQNTCVNPHAINDAAGNGHVEVVRWLSERFSLKIHDFALMAAASNGCQNVLAFWLETKPTVSSSLLTSLLNNATGGGHLGLARWLVETHPEAICTHRAATLAARNGHLEAFRWLASRMDLHSGEVFTPLAMDWAAHNGHLDLVRWLDDRGVECTTNAMDWAAFCGHLSVVQWLHENRTEGCTTAAMNMAAQNGHLELVRWLHENRNEGCTTKAMNRAAENGHLEVIRWLHENRTEGCTTNAMDKAAANGHAHVLRWLHENRREGCTEKASCRAAFNGHLRVLKWLRETQRARLDDDALISEALRNNMGHVAAWLVRKSLESAKR